MHDVIFSAYGQEVLRSARFILPKPRRDSFLRHCRRLQDESCTPNYGEQSTPPVHIKDLVS
jgi:hypothetical protein